MNYSEKVYKIVSKIPKGKVSTYQQIAKFCKINNPRLVGFYLHKNLDPKTIPCHRVVNVKGELTGYVFGGVKKKREILEKEGIKFVGNKINLKKYLFKLY